MKKLMTLVFLVGLVLRAFAADFVVEAPPLPEKGLVLKFCRTNYYGQNALCYTREFLEQRGNDLVFLVQEDGSATKKELVIALQDGYFGLRIRPIGVLNTYAPHAFQAKFPLRVGTRWEGTWTQIGSEGAISRTRTAEIIGYGEIKIEAGSFKAFEIRSSNQRQGRNSPAQEHYYFSPELFAIVMFESKEFNMKEQVVEVRRPLVGLK